MHVVIVVVVVVVLKRNMEKIVSRNTKGISNISELVL